jgi:hypothetical protein
VKVRPKNWGSFQHYKDRNPPWIKLHKALLDDFGFHCLPDASRALAPCLWLLASEHSEGEIDANPQVLGFRLRKTSAQIEAALKPLIESGFFIPLQSDSNALAEREQDAMPETETEERRGRECATPKFEDFWKSYPGPRKVGKAKCLLHWRTHGFELLADQIVLHVAAMAQTPQWREANGKFIPAPLTYLNQRRFEDGFPDAPRVRLAI